MNWVYVQSEPTLWTVGFYGPRGDWHSDSDHDVRAEAGKRVAFLNGKNCTEADDLIRSLGFDPDRFRTDGGSINHMKLVAAIKNPADYVGLKLTEDFDE